MAGRRSEKKVEKLLNSWGYKCERVPLSGAIKSERYSGDLRVVINNKEYKIENKKRTNFSRIRGLLERGKGVVIEGFCAVVDQETFHAVLNGIKPDITNIADVNFGYLHKFFEQDNADIVTLDEPWKDIIFVISLSVWKELIDNGA